VRMLRDGDSWFSSKVVVMAASSDLLMVWRSGWDLISMCVYVYVDGLTTHALIIGFPRTWDPSTYINDAGWFAA